MKRWMYGMISSLRQLHKSKPTRREVVFISEHIVTILQAGIPLIETLDAELTSLRGARQQSFVRKAKQTIIAGGTLSQAWKSQIDDDFYALLCAGEAVGAVATAIQQYLTRCAARDSWRQRLFNIISYPLLLLLMMFALVLFLSLRVMPMYTNMYAQLGYTENTQIHTISRCLAEVPEVVGAVLALMVSVLGFGVYISRRQLAGSWQRLTNARFLRAMRWYRTQKTFARLHLLLTGGMSLLDAMAHLRTATKSRLMKSVYLSVEETLREGMAVEQAFQTMVDPVSRAILMTAQKTGDFAAAAAKVHQYTERRLFILLERMATWSQPILLTVMGILVGASMYVVFIPMYDLIGTISNKSM